MIFSGGSKLTEEISSIVSALFIWTDTFYWAVLYFYMICLHGVIQYIDQTCLNFRVCTCQRFCIRLGSGNLHLCHSGWCMTWVENSYMSLQTRHVSGQIRGHPKWWFCKGNPLKNAINSGLGIVLICPDVCWKMLEVYQFSFIRIPPPEV